MSYGIEDIRDVPTADLVRDIAKELRRREYARKLNECPYCSWKESSGHEHTCRYKDGGFHTDSLHFSFDYTTAIATASGSVGRPITPKLPLTFQQLREANKARLPQFKNSKGEPAHSEPDGSDWKLSAWSNAVAGEVGESANIIKKIERGDMTLDEARPALAKELADVATYLDILAFRCGVNLGYAVANKFNEISMRVMCDVLLPNPPAAY